MPTTDTFIIPPVNAQTAEKPDTSNPKKKSGKGKWLILIGLVLLIIALPIGVYYISQQQQLADTRSRAVSTGTCNFLTEEADVNCKATHCASATTATSCNAYPCCNWVAATTVTPTTKPTVTSTIKPTATTAPTGCRNSGTQYSCTGTCPGDSTCIVIGASSCTCSVSGCRQTGTANAPSCGGACPSGQTCTLTGQASCMCTGQAATPTKPPSLPNAATSTPTTKPTNAPNTTPTTAPNTTPTTAPTAEPTVEPTNPPSEPGTCDASCQTDANCVSGLSCASVDGINRCRDAACPAKSNCSCDVAANPTDTPNTGGADVSGQEMPVSGVGPGILGSITVIGSILLLVIGLIL